MKCCLGSSARSRSRSPSTSGGTTASVSTSSSCVSGTSSRDSTYTAMKPWNFSVEPWARKRQSLARMSAATVSYTAGSIWLARKRSQISR